MINEPDWTASLHRLRTVYFYESKTSQDDKSTRFLWGQSVYIYLTAKVPETLNLQGRNSLAAGVHLPG